MEKYQTLVISKIHTECECLASCFERAPAIWGITLAANERRLILQISMFSLRCHQYFALPISLGAPTNRNLCRLSPDWLWQTVEETWPFLGHQSEIMKSFSEVSELVGLKNAHDLQISAAEWRVQSCEWRMAKWWDTIQGRFSFPTDNFVLWSSLRAAVKTHKGYLKVQPLKSKAAKSSLRDIFFAPDSQKSITAAQTCSATHHKHVHPLQTRYGPRKLRHVS